MNRKKTGTKQRNTIPDEVKEQAWNIIDQFNQKHSGRDDCYYEAQFKGKHCYLNRCDYGQMGPICRLTYTGKMDNWEFAIFKWSSERYDPDEWFFPGSECVDGTIKGAMKAGIEAYPV